MKMPAIKIPFYHRILILSPEMPKIKFGAYALANDLAELRRLAWLQKLESR